MYLKTNYIAKRPVTRFGVTVTNIATAAGARSSRAARGCTRTSSPSRSVTGAGAGRRATSSRAPAAASTPTRWSGTWTGTGGSRPGQGAQLQVRGHSAAPAEIVFLGLPSYYIHNPCLRCTLVKIFNVTTEMVESAVSNGC